MSRVVIFANGELSEPERVRDLLRADDFLLCADGGTRHARQLGLSPQLVLGDLDSADPLDLQLLQAQGAQVERFPRDKNETDLELALTRALSLTPSDILVIGALGGRLDQTLANLALLARPDLAGCAVRLDDGIEQILLCRDQAQVQGRPGDLVSLIPWAGPVTGIQTRGLKWPLQDETLFPDHTRGISNELVADVASLQIRSGLLLVIHRRQRS